MRIATFNINGIKARLEALLQWLGECKPDVALLQELKSTDEAFPAEPIEALGYNVATHGQKGFNGVAILSRHPIEDVVRGLPGDDGDEQARWIEATVCGDGRPVRVVSLYLPNGNPAPGPKFDYKLAWMARMRDRVGDILATEEPTVLAGDYNVIAQPEDAEFPDRWLDDALFRPESRAAFRRILYMGLTDAFRVRHRGKGHYTFWDYQRGAYQENNGIRIDYALLTPQAADLLEDAYIDAHIRSRERPSDHVPVVIELRDRG
ncbi:MAG: exodeoxyribonuclease III [Alphaproteobacteria bacterium]|nr:MAG: exodeoxyribonuclease III [Alphaproteobacteria bacterium]